MPNIDNTVQSKSILICGGVTFLFFTILTITIIVDSVHYIEEGTVGVYYVRGALIDEIGNPGRHWAIPFSTRIEHVKTRPSTYTVRRISTITKDGIKNEFVNVRVISSVHISKLIPLIRKYGLEFREPLVFDRIGEELKKYCANHTIDEVYNEKFLEIVGIVKGRVENSIERLMGNDSITILKLVIPKPAIPKDIARNYQQVKLQWTEQLVAQQRQKTEKIKEETKSIKAVLDAEREKRVLEIDIQKNLLEKEGERNISTLNNAILKEREENKANVENYRKSKDAEANAKLYTKDYVRLEIAKALSNNTKFFFSGESSPLGAVLSKILGNN